MKREILEEQINRVSSCMDAVDKLHVVGRDSCYRVVGIVNDLEKVLFALCREKEKDVDHGDQSPDPV